MESIRVTVEKLGPRGWQYRVDMDERWDNRLYPTADAAEEAARQELDRRAYADHTMRVMSGCPLNY